MISKTHFGQIINFLINIVLGIVLTAVGLTLAHNMSLLVFIQNFVVSMAVGYTICDLIPASVLGKRISEKIKIKGKLGSHLFSTAVAGAILVTCISFFCQFVAVGPALPLIWPHALPYLLISGYIVLIIFIPICEKIAEVLTK